MHTLDSDMQQAHNASNQTDLPTTTKSKIIQKEVRLHPYKSEVGYLNQVPRSFEKKLKISEYLFIFMSTVVVANINGSSSPTKMVMIRNCLYSEHFLFLQEFANTDFSVIDKIRKCSIVVNCFHSASALTKKKLNGKSEYNQFSRNIYSTLISVLFSSSYFLS